MKVKVTFNVSKKNLNKVLEQIGSKELKDRIQTSMEFKLAPIGENPVRITGLKMEVSE